MVKLVGAAYIIYLGIRLLWSNATELNLEEVQRYPLRQLFAQGAVSNISNPKITIFYFAFLPQFFSADASNPTQILLLLGVTFALITFFVKGPVGYFAGSLSSWLRARPRVLTWIDRTSGMVLIGLGLGLAFEQRA